MSKLHFNKKNLKSRLFYKLFGSYVLIIIGLFLIYSAVVFVENIEINRERKTQYYQLKIQEVKNVLDVQLVEADAIISNINASDTIRNYNMNWNSNNISVSDVINEIRGYMLSCNNLNIYDTILVFENSDKIYTSTQMYEMQQAYNGQKAENINGVRIASVNELYGLRNEETIMSKEWFLYSSDYSTLFANGTVTILFDAADVTDSIKQVLGQDNGYAVYINDRFIDGEVLEDSVAFSETSMMGTAVNYRLEVKRSFFGVDINRYFAAAILLAVAVVVIFIILAFVLANQYYKPVGHIEKIIDETVGSSEGENEFENIIAGIQGLIGERNGYRERMITIRPYIQQGVLHGMVSGNIEADHVKVLSQQEYMVLQKPYYMIAVVNAAYTGNNRQFDPKELKQIKRVIQDTAAEISDEELSVYVYDKDLFHTYLIINANDSEGLGDLFFQMFQIMNDHIENRDYILTLGVDEVRENLSQLNEACSNAMRALEGMTAGGRGTVYYYEKEIKADRQKYYFPKDAVNVVTKALRRRNLGEIEQFLKGILKENMEQYELSPSTVQLLIDEIHITTVKALKNVNPDNRIEFSIQKINTVATLEEILEYYYIIYKTFCEKLDEFAEDRKETDELDQKIIDYINEQFQDSNLSLQHLTDKFGVSNKYISLMCKKYLGVTYLQYVQGKRIAAAVALMETTEDSLERIAEKVGYTNLLTFRRNFKTVMGVNPSEYKK